MFNRNGNGLPDGGWTKNLFNSLVHPNLTRFDNLVTLIAVVVCVGGVIYGLVSLVFGLQHVGEAFVVALAAIVFAVIYNISG